MSPRNRTSRSVPPIVLATFLLVLPVRCSSSSADPDAPDARVVQPEMTGDGWETATLSSVGMDRTMFEDLLRQVDAGSYGEVHSVVVVKDKKLVFEAYWPGHDFAPFDPEYHGEYLTFDRDTRHDTHSATKSITSTLVGISIDRGLIHSEDDTIFSYLPDTYATYASQGRERISLRDCLRMASGLQWNEWEEAVTARSNDLMVFNSSDDPIAFLLSKPLATVPGTGFYYNGATVDLLGALVAYAGDYDLRYFAATYLFGPLGVTNYNWQVLRSGLVVCHGDIYITPRDMAKFGQLYLDDGVWEGNRIISHDWVERSTQYQIDPTVSWADGYGYLWWLRDLTVNGTTVHSVKAMGWGGQEIFILKDLSMVVVFTGANYTGAVPCDDIMVRYILPAAGMRGRPGGNGGMNR